jgi:hypothetical protein
MTEGDGGRRFEPRKQASRAQKATTGCGGCFSVLVILWIIGMVFGDGDSGFTMPMPKKETTAPATPEATAEPVKTFSPTPVETQAVLPDYSGKGLQAAQDAAQELGFYHLRSKDLSGAGRHQVWDRNWKVCAQSPRPGRYSTDRTITFKVVKVTEFCFHRAGGRTTSGSTG